MNPVLQKFSQMRGRTGDVDTKNCNTEEDGHVSSSRVHGKGSVGGRQGKPHSSSWRVLP